MTVRTTKFVVLQIINLAGMALTLYLMQTANAQYNNFTNEDFLLRYILAIRNEEASILLVYSQLTLLGSLLNFHSVIVNIHGSLELKNDLWRIDFYLMILNNVEDFGKFIRNFYRSPAWYPGARFLLILTTKQPLGEYFSLAWKHFVVNLSVVVQETLEVFTYLPTAKGGSCSSFEVKKVCDFYCNLSTVFPHKEIVSNYYGCPVRVLYNLIPPFIINATAEENPGFEILLLRTQAEKLNFSVSYVDNPYAFWGYKMENGTYTEMTSMLYAGAADIMIGLAGLNSTYINDFDSVGYYYEYATFFVPTALPVEPWRNLTWVFDDLVWVSIALSVLLVSLTFWLSEAETNYFAIINWVFKVLCILTSSFNSKPKTWLMRALFVWWSVDCYLLSSMYQGTLMSFLTKPAMEHQISNLEELVDSNLLYGGMDMGKIFFYKPSNPLFMKIYNNWVYCDTSNACNNRTAFQRDYAIIRSVRHMAFLTPKYYTRPDGTKMIYGFKQPLNGIFHGTILNKGFPLFKMFEKLTFTLMENGLLSKWQAEQEKASAGIFLKGGGSSLIVLTLNHLKLAFALLFAGNFGACIVFFVEIYVNWFNSQCNT